MAARESRGVSWLVDLRRFAPPNPDRIGPGRLVMVVGPSGAGKDTLIDGARNVCANDTMVVFSRRVITRPPSPSEDNESVSQQTFNRLAADGKFALWWDAHGHRYGIPSSIDEDIRAGRTVVSNMSRTIIGVARRRYAAVTVVLVTAPAKVLEARLARRDRESDGSLNDRLARAAPVGDVTDADVIIRNIGHAEVGVRRLMNVIRDCGIFVVS
jgi:ribose 1,5-bisphosphokinase